jgi:hypothetical protein
MASLGNVKTLENLRKSIRYPRKNPVQQREKSLYKNPKNDLEALKYSLKPLWAQDFKIRGCSSSQTFVTFDLMSFKIKKSVSTLLAKPNPTNKFKRMFRSCEWKEKYEECIKLYN